jgi:hypothetical protein
LGGVDVKFAWRGGRRESTVGGRVDRGGIVVEAAKGYERCTGSKIVVPIQMTCLSWLIVVGSTIITIVIDHYDEDLQSIADRWQGNSQSTL